jgi:hypothetical protein
MKAAGATNVPDRLGVAAWIRGTTAPRGRHCGVAPTQARNSSDGFGPSRTPLRCRPHRRSEFISWPARNVGGERHRRARPDRRGDSALAPEPPRTLVAPTHESGRSNECAESPRCRGMDSGNHCPSRTPLRCRPYTGPEFVRWIRPFADATAVSRPLILGETFVVS